jgi:hypothetical protein
MGLRRLRGRLDQVQGEANETMALAQDLLADLKDGFGITASIDAVKLQSLVKSLLVGNAIGTFELPITLKIDPSVDTEHRG